MTARMRAVRQRSFGGPEVLELALVDRPEPLPTEVLVRVHAAGVNPVDWKTRAGGGFARLFGEPPFTLGWDVAGVVERVAPGVTRFAPGDRVLGMPLFPRPAGGYAEYVAAPSRHFVRTPDELDDVSAGGLPVAGLTAWQVLVDTADVRPGERVLVHAAAGGVGHLAVQVAKARGAYVLGTARRAKHGFLRSLGVDEPVDYTAVRLADAVRDVDVAVDLVGDAGVVPTLRRSGLLVVVPSAAREDVLEAAARRGVRATRFLVEPDHAGLAALVDLVRSGRMRVEVEHLLPLDQAGRAHEIGETGRTSGKIVLSVTG